MRKDSADDALTGGQCRPGGAGAQARAGTPTPPPKEAFTDVRELHAAAKDAGLKTEQETGLEGSGVGSFVLVDPDGNPVLIDQHVPKPS